MDSKLVNFLKSELSLSEDSIDLALTCQKQTTANLPLILWEFGLITWTQLEMLCQWLEESKYNSQTRA